jgi:hypothetical protein
MVGVVALLPAWASAQGAAPLSENVTNRIDALNALYGELDAVTRELDDLHDLYRQDPGVAKLKRAAARARKAADAAVAELRRADDEADTAVEEYNALQTRVGWLERKRSVIRARVERMPDMQEARQARDKAREEAEALERAAMAEYESLYRAKLTNNVEWVRVEAEIDSLRRKDYALRNRAKELDRRAMQAPEVIAAANALARARRTCDNRLREAVSATVGGRVALGVMEELEQHRRELERQLGIVRDSAAEDPQVADLREVMMQCRKRRYAADSAYRVLVERELDGNEEAAGLKVLILGARTGLRDRLEERLNGIRESVEKQPDVIAAGKARREAIRAYEAAYVAYEKKFTAMVAAHPDAAVPGAVLRELRDATHKVRGLQAVAQRDNPRVKAANEASGQAEQALKRAGEAVRERARQIVARDPEGAALSKRRNEIEKAIRELDSGY